MNRIVAGFTLIALLASCSSEPQRREAQPSPPKVAPAAQAPSARPTVDPKSNEAAEELVRGFIRLLNQGRFGDAYMLLGPNAPSRGQFDRQWSSYSSLEVTSGRAGAQDGAAGSIYVSVPLTVSGKVEGKNVRRSATVVLRRVNDVPGSSEAQRRWHIERIDWQGAS